MILVRLLIFFAGLSIVVATILSAIKTFVLPRSAPDTLTRAVFVFIRILFGLPLKLTNSYTKRDQIMAFYAPISLLCLVPVWYAIATLGYEAMYWALGVKSWQEAFLRSGSSIFTLGFSAPGTLPEALLAFSEAGLGLLLVALLIAYLPTMYAAFSRRESAVTLLEVRAGNPPSAIEMILRFNRIHGLEALTEMWETWEIWFADIEESHTSLPALVFFRSPQPDHSWVTAAGAILDAAALTLSVVDIPYAPQAALSIRAGYLALQRISDFYSIPYPSSPQYPGNPISITRAEFDAACSQLSAGGVPIKQDDERAWQDFAGWRVNYDNVLLALASLTIAPIAPWSSDRTTPHIFPPSFLLRK